MTRAAALLVGSVAACGGKPAPGSVTQRGLDALTRVCASWGVHGTSSSKGDRETDACRTGRRLARVTYRVDDRHLVELDLDDVPPADLEALHAQLVDDVLDADTREVFRTMRAFVETGAAPPDGNGYTLTAARSMLKWRGATWWLDADRSGGGWAILISEAAAGGTAAPPR